MQAAGGFLLILIGIGAMVTIIAPQLIGTIEILIKRKGLSTEVKGWHIRTKTVVFFGGLLLFFLGLGALLQVSFESILSLFTSPGTTPVAETTVTVSQTITQENPIALSETPPPVATNTPTPTELSTSTITPLATSTTSLVLPTSPTSPTSPTTTMTPQPTEEPTSSPSSTSPSASPIKDETPPSQDSPTSTPTFIIITIPPAISTPSPTREFSGNSTATNAVPSPQGKLAFSFIDKESRNFKTYVLLFPEKNGVIRLTSVNLLDNARQPMFRYDNQTLVFKGVGGVQQGLFYKKSNNPSCFISDIGKAQWPVWSSVGNKIVFAVVNSDDPNKSELYMLSSDFGRFIQDDQCPPALPFVTKLQLDGKSLTGEHVLWLDHDDIIFRGCATWVDDYGTCGTWKFDINFSQQPRQIIPGDHRYPMDARDGLITLMSDELDGMDEKNDWDIYLYSSEGDQPINVTNNTAQDGLPAISPDGNYIAYISDEKSDPEQWRLWIVDRNTLIKESWAEIAFNQNEQIDVQSWTADRMSWTK